MIKVEIDNNKNPIIACQRCGRRLSLFETVYFDAKYCSSCMNAPRE